MILVIKAKYKPNKKLMYKLIYKITANKGVWLVIDKVTKRIVIAAYKHSEAKACLAHVNLIVEKSSQNNLTSAATS